MVILYRIIRAPKQQLAICFAFKVQDAHTMKGTGINAARKLFVWPQQTCLNASIANQQKPRLVYLVCKFIESSLLRIKRGLYQLVTGFVNEGVRRATPGWWAISFNQATTDTENFLWPVRPEEVL